MSAGLLAVLPGPLAIELKAAVLVGVFFGCLTPAFTLNFCVCNGQRHIALLVAGPVLLYAAVLAILSIWSW